MISHQNAIRLLLLYACTGAFTGESKAQYPAGPQVYFDAHPEVSITFEASSFDMFDPVVATITATNTSDKTQFYGPILGGRSSGFSVELRGQDGDLVAGNGMFRELWGIDYRIDARRPFLSGEDASIRLPLSITWPIWREVGTYTLEVSFTQLDRTGSDLIASQSFTITRPEGVSPVLVDTLLYAANWVFGQDWGMEPSRVEGALDTVIAVGAQHPLWSLRHF